MNKTEFKKGIQAELNANHLSFRNLLKKVTDTGVNTTLVFQYAIDEATKQWLQNRFTHGVSFTDTDHTLCFVNTPNQNNKGAAEFVANLTDAKKIAQAKVDGNGLPVHILYVHGSGFKIVPIEFVLDRNYYHGEGGKKMFFDFIETVTPTNKYKKRFMVLSFFEAGVLCDVSGRIGGDGIRHIFVSAEEGTYGTIEEAMAGLDEMTIEESKNDSDLRFKIEEVYSKF